MLGFPLMVLAVPESDFEGAPEIVDQKSLLNFVRSFAGQGEYLLSVDCGTEHASINLDNQSLALMLCETAKASGHAKHVVLFHIPLAGPVCLFRYDREK